MERPFKEFHISPSTEEAELSAGPAFLKRRGMEEKVTDRGPSTSSG